MKVCPICHDVAFDDAETCFGCLHRFGEEDTVVAENERNRDGEVPSRFLISLTPTRVHGETRWDCRVEPVRC